LKRLRDNCLGIKKVLTLEMTKMPLGAKLTQNDSDAIFGMDFDMELNKNLFKPIERSKREFSRTKMS
jgi:hypothetical protein